MDTKKNNAHRSKEECCDICGDILTKGMCSKCGWVQIIFPNIVPSEITDFNTLRKNAAKNLHKKCSDSEVSLKQMKEMYETELSKNKKIEQDLNDSRIKEQVTKKENERNKTLLEKANKELSSLQYKNQGLVDNVQSLTSQNQSLKTERDLALKEIEKLKQNPPVSAGAQLRIIEKHGKYRLQDTSGLVCRANGQSIGEHGIELYDGYVFKVGNVRFTVTVPELDITNINL